MPSAIAFPRTRARLAAASILILGLTAPLLPGIGAAEPSPGSGPVPAAFDVRAYGARGDGRTLDSFAINQAIDDAAAHGGGTVVLPAGTYECGSIRLHSHVGLYLGPGSVIEAVSDPNAYDPPEPNPGEDASGYEDFGHRHWHNSLIWGDGVEDVSITGPGVIYGKGLSRGNDRFTHDPVPDFKWSRNGNKAIALKDCRNVILRDFTIRHGGWFGILAIAADNLTVDNLKIDTNRDGMDIDCCRNVRISNCTVNSPYDDGICLKSCFGLGRFRSTQNVTIANCQVSGYDEGSLLNGTYTRNDPKWEGPCGRIKLGTESNGGFKNVAISNCVFECCRGLALETADGAALEDVTVSNLAMRDIVNAPIYVRIGERMRGPAGTPVGVCRRIVISNVAAHTVSGQSGILIVGSPGHPIEDLMLDHILIDYAGGGTRADGAIRLPENAALYPEPDRIGTVPAWGLYVRHAQRLTLDHIDLRCTSPDFRPGVRLIDAGQVDADRLVVPHQGGAPALVVQGVDGLRVRNSPGIPDLAQDGPVADKSF